MIRKLVVYLVVVCISLIAASAVFAQGDYGIFCPGAPMPRLVDGQQGRVTPGLPNVIRTQPGRGWNSAIVGQIPGGAVFNVLAGYAPQCADGMYWWYVSYNGVVGWTAEAASDGAYWTEPVGYAGYCAQPTRLIPGQQGRVTPGLPNLIRSQPGRGWNSTVVGQIPAGGVFNVIYGYAAQCGDGMWWFYVNYNGIVGWTPEGDGANYWTEPYSQSNACPANLPSRLWAGGWGRVAPGLPNTLRSQPAMTSARIGRIPAGSIFSVISGPQCNQGMAWWQVNFNGVVGWTAEGRWGQYWLQPF